jgi:hypothetical protein
MMVSQKNYNAISELLKYDYKSGLVRQVSLKITKTCVSPPVLSNLYELTSIPV